MFSSRSNVLYLLAIVCISGVGEVNSQSALRKFSNKYNFPGVTTGDELMTFYVDVYGLNTQDSYLTINMTRDTVLETLDRSCRHVPVRFSPYHKRTYQLMEGNTQRTIQYFIKGQNMVIISEFPFDGTFTFSTTGYRKFLMANQGMIVNFLETSLTTK